MNEKLKVTDKIMEIVDNETIVVVRNSVLHVEHG